MQYDFTEDGGHIEPYDWCRRSFKHVGDNSISDRSEKELDDIILELKKIKTHY